MKIVTYPAVKMEDAKWDPVPPEKVVAGTPRHTYRILYTNVSKEFYSGVYECSPGKWNVNYEEDEFCTLHEGNVRLTPKDGEPMEFLAPASFMIPSGFQGTWEAMTYVRKYFVIYEKLK